MTALNTTQQLIDEHMKDSRGKPLYVNDEVAFVTSGKYYSSSRPDYGKIAGYWFENNRGVINCYLRFFTRKVVRAAHEVLKLEQ